MAPIRRPAGEERDRSEPLDLAEREALFRRGIDEFNRGDFFESHDTLEEVWMEERGAERRFTQGLIQIAVACYHLTVRGNLRGAKRLFREGAAKIESFLPVHRGVDAASLHGQAKVCLAEVEAMERGEKSAFDRELLPQIRTLAEDA